MVLRFIIIWLIDYYTLSLFIIWVEIKIWFKCEVLEFEFILYILIK